MAGDKLGKTDGREKEKGKTGEWVSHHSNSKTQRGCGTVAGYDKVLAAVQHCEYLRKRVSQNTSPLGTVLRAGQYAIT
jgi:hypothetical protein